MSDTKTIVGKFKELTGINEPYATEYVNVAQKAKDSTILTSRLKKGAAYFEKTSTATTEIENFISTAAKPTEYKYTINVTSDEPDFSAATITINGQTNNGVGKTFSQNIAHGETATWPVDCKDYVKQERVSEVITKETTNEVKLVKSAQPVQSENGGEIVTGKA